MTGDGIHLGASYSVVYDDDGETRWVAGEAVWKGAHALAVVKTSGEEVRVRYDRFLSVLPLPPPVAA